MSQPGTFDRVYAALKQRLRGGGFRPGEKLEPATLSLDLNASVTPVRDALHRLTGERLVEAPRHEGFRVPVLTESMLRHLYAWHLDLLLLALAGRRAREAPGGLAKGVPRRLDGAFGLLAAASGNPELAATLRNVGERLEPYERLEREFLDLVDLEIEQIVAAIEAQDRRRLRASLVHYHRRRQRVVPLILARLHEPE